MPCSIANSNFYQELAASVNQEPQQRLVKVYYKRYVGDKLRLYYKGGRLEFSDPGKRWSFIKYVILQK